MANPAKGLFALVRAGYVLAREGVVSALPADGLPPMARVGHRLAGMLASRSAKRQARSDRLSAALNRLGPSYVKLGQFLATRPDIVGSTIALELGQLQDKVPPFPKAEAMRAVEVTLGRTIDDLFVEFGEIVGAASIAQVHRATIRTPEGATRTVAVKVIRPGVRERFLREIETFRFIARFLELVSPASRRLRPVAVVETLAQSTKIEMDLRLEAAASSEMAEYIAQDPGYRVPAIDWERTGRDVVTMEWVDGIKMRDIEAVRAAGHDLPQLGVNLIQAFLRQAMRDGFFHADMHPGNLFVAPDGGIVAVDLGIVGRLDAESRRVLAEVLYGFIRRDYMRVAEVHFEAGYVPRHQDVASFAQALRAIGEPIHGQPADTISMAHLLTLLFEVTELFDMRTRPELILLQKTMVVVEGVARSYDPHFNMWSAAEPVVSDYILRELGPAAKLREAKDGLEALVTLVRRGPQFAKGLEILSRELPDLIENGIHINDDDILKMVKDSKVAIAVGHVAQVVAAIALVVIAWQLVAG